jgi:glycosyltransferase involved in cell wall biosynthesis
MAHGIPVVTTSIGAEGMDLRPGTDVMIADEPREFARCIVELHEDASLWERISRNALEKVRTRWTPEAVGAPLLHLLSVKPRLPSDA